MKRKTRIVLLSLSVVAAGFARASEPVDIGARRELFVDRALIERFDGGAELRLHHPTPRETALAFDRPWEGNASGYPTVIQDGDLYRMYYRGHRFLVDDKPLRQAQSEVVCYAESTDGVRWTKPNLGLFEWMGSKENNILWMGGPETHNFAPFLDARPGCPPEERFKAVGGTVTSNGLLSFTSADGIRWKRRSEQPIVSEGAFDSHNTVFWDGQQHRYAMYVRYFSEGQFQGLRSIGMAHSADFDTWSKPVPVSYGESPPQQMYTNQIAPYYRAPHLLFGFPTRYTARPLTSHVRGLEPVELRSRLLAADLRVGTDLSDGLFLASRDGAAFERYDEAFLRPGPENEGRWIYGDNYQSYGLFETDDYSPEAGSPGAGREISMHFSEGAWRDDECRLRRYTIRLDGFISLHAPLAGGEVTTRPIVFSGEELELNYSTSAAGGVRVEIQDADGRPIEGFTLADGEELYGDSTSESCRWKNGKNVAAIAGRPVKLRFVVRDGDVYSYRFISATPKEAENR